jgi:membrane-associated protease RseP (regulator of RpoE activity)
MMQAIANTLYEFVAALVLCVAIHEAGHVLAARALNLRLGGLHFRRMSPYVLIENGGPMENIAVALAGPLANLLIGSLIGWHIVDGRINIVVGLANLIPLVTGSDGWLVMKNLKAILKGTYA